MDPERYRLTVSGLVESPLRLSLEEVWNLLGYVNNARHRDEIEVGG